MAPECIGELEHEFRISDGETYVWDCATRSRHRRKGLYKALLNHLILALAKEGLRRVWIGSSLDNRPSQKAFARAGFQPVASVLYARLFNLSCLMISPHARAPGGLAADARRMLVSSQERAWGPFLFRYARSSQLPACA
jgi:ribosomal protein S18 acetylase RimI-like enzyme